MTETILKVTYDPSVITLLGEQLYRQFPPVLNELISNSYDANAKKVVINYKKSKKEFSISDDGDGMDLYDLQNKYLVIGRNRRLDSDDTGRLPTGRKGVGKLAPFGIATIIEIETTKNKKTHSYRLDLDKIKLTGNNKNYKPEKISIENKKESGTKITVKNVILNNFVSRKISDDAFSLSSRFNKFSDDFVVTIKDEDQNEQEILDKDYYKKHSLDKRQFIWKIPEDLDKLDNSGKLKTELSKFSGNNSIVNGEIYSTKTPIKNTSQTGIFIYSRGKLSSEPSFFDLRSSDLFNSYTSGNLNIDWIDEQKDDLITTSRQGITWDKTKDSIELKKILQSIIKKISTDWKNKRKKQKEDELKSTFDNFDPSLKNIKKLVDDDDVERKRYEKVNETIAEALTNDSDSGNEMKKISEEIYGNLSKPARINSSVYKDIVPTELLELSSDITNRKIKKILEELKNPVIADNQEEFINMESLLLRGLIDSLTSAFLIDNIDMFKKHFKELKADPFISENFSKKVNYKDINDVFIENKINFADKYKISIIILKKMKKIGDGLVNNFISALSFPSSEENKEHKNNAIKNLNIAMHSPKGMINFNELKNHWDELTPAFVELIKNLK